MPPSALGLLLVAAVCHASWNFLLKGTRETFVITWWAMVFSCVPAVLVLLCSTPLPREALLFAGLSALFQATYYFTLTSAYRAGDFSLVYPVARGAAPLFLLVWAMLFLQEKPTPVGVGGVLLLLCGLITIASNNLKREAHIPRAALGLALLTALFISLYSVTDGAAVKQFPPAPYSALIFIVTTLAMTPLVMARHRFILMRELHAGWHRAALIGVLSLVSYGLALSAYSLGKVSYAGAVREISIVFGALAGWKWMNEDFGARRTVGALLMFMGIVVIALAK
jgi:drug/metabolite transporter (DMT)-like permease